jgi:hypothetical protein
MEHCVVTIFKHQVEPPLPSEDFQEVDEIWMLELLKSQKARCSIQVVKEFSLIVIPPKESCLLFSLRFHSLTCRRL